MKRWPARLLLAVALAVAVPPARACTTPPAEAPADKAVEKCRAGATAVPASPPWAMTLRDEANRVLAGPDFQRSETSRQLVRREWLRRWMQSNDDTSGSRLPNLPLATIAAVLKWMLVALLVAALAWLLWRGARWLAPRIGRPEPKANGVLPAESLPLALAEAALPVSVSRAARDAWERGDAVLALSLLYRGAVQAMSERYHVAMPASATEGECLRVARRSGQAVGREAFAPIVRAWMGLAYGGQRPDDFHTLLALYARHFEPAGSAPA